jgi:hypothetical protein
MARKVRSINDLRRVQGRGSWGYSELQATGDQVWFVAFGVDGGRNEVAWPPADRGCSILLELPSPADSHELVSAT